jgi:hypothetical protein
VASQLLARHLDEGIFTNYNLWSVMRLSRDSSGHPTLSMSRPVSIDGGFGYLIGPQVHCFLRPQDPFLPVSSSWALLWALSLRMLLPQPLQVPVTADLGHVDVPVGHQTSVPSQTSQGGSFPPITPLPKPPLHSDPPLIRVVKWHTTLNSPPR